MIIFPPLGEMGGSPIYAFINKRLATQILRFSLHMVKFVLFNHSSKSFDKFIQQSYNHIKIKT